MSETRPYRVEVAVRAPREAVWRALTEPEQIRRWFGWDYDGLEAEIQFIFVEHAERLPPDRVRFADGTAPPQEIALEPDGERTRVSVTGPGADGYDAIEEGWRTFFEQLRHQLERHPGEDRRTLRLTGEAVAADVVAALDAAVPGQAWRSGAYQWLKATPEHDDALVSVTAEAPIEDGDRGPVALTLVTFGLDDAAFAAAREEWEARFSTLATPG
jgi:uncharacterized protein YndB with AHSA1/START domain